MHLTTALLLLALAWPGVTFGAEAADEAAASDESGEARDEGEDTAADAAEDPILAEAAEAESTPDPRSGADDTFVPSVRISEDLSVSFPADI